MKKCLHEIGSKTASQHSRSDIFSGLKTSSQISSKVDVPEAKRLGADEALPSNQILADFALGRLEELKAKF